MFSFAGASKIYQTVYNVLGRSFLVFTEKGTDSEYLTPDIVLSDCYEIIPVRFVYRASFNGVA